MTRRAKKIKRDAAAYNARKAEMNVANESPVSAQQQAARMHYVAGSESGCTTWQQERRR